jgi:hypothetical protein
LLLLTIALVLVGAVALVIGFVGGDQLPIFISIACSLLAGGVLVVFSRMSRRQAGVPASAPAPLADAPATRKQVAVSDDEVEEAVVDEPAATSAREFSPDGAFPIEDYDELLVSEILPLLPELDPDELELVREREESGKARATLLRRIEQIGEEEGGEPTVAAPAVGRRAAAEVEEEEEPEYDDGGEDELMFPIEDYDDLRVSEILPLLPELYDDELELVSERERDGANRASVLNRINELLGGAPAPVKAAPKKASAKKAAPARRAPAPAKKATPARRAPAPAKKAAPARRAPAPAKRAAPAKKAVAKKAVAKKAAPAKKTVAKKAAAKKAPAKKTAARRR